MFDTTCQLAIKPGFFSPVGTPSNAIFTAFKNLWISVRRGLQVVGMWLIFRWVYVILLQRHARIQRDTLREIKCLPWECIIFHTCWIISRPPAACTSCEVKPFSRSIDSDLLLAAAECFCLGALGEKRGDAADRTPTGPPLPRRVQRRPLSCELPWGPAV